MLQPGVRTPIIFTAPETACTKHAKQGCITSRVSLTDRLDLVDGEPVCELVKGIEPGVQKKTRINDEAEKY